MCKDGGEEGRQCRRDTGWVVGVGWGPRAAEKRVGGSADGREGAETLQWPGGEWRSGEERSGIQENTAEADRAKEQARMTTMGGCGSSEGLKGRREFRRDGEKNAPLMAWINGRFDSSNC